MPGIETIKIRRPRVDAALAPETADTKERTVNAQFYSGATVRRYSWSRGGDYLLSFSMEPAHVRLESLNSGRAPLLESHSDWSTQGVLGVVEKGWIEDGAGKARVRFAKDDPDADRVWRKVSQGVLRNVSMGVTIHKLRETTKDSETVKSFEAVDWEPIEISVVPIGADPGAQMLAAQNAGEEIECEVERTGATAPLGEAMSEEIEAGQVANSDAPEILKLASVMKDVPNASALAQDLIARGTGINEARRIFVDRMAEASAAYGQTQSHHAAIARDAKDGMVQAMSEALASRYTGQQPSERAREYTAASVAELARVLCQNAGVRVPWFGKERVIEMAMHSTSDFPALVTETGNRMLLAAYVASQPAITRIARRSSAPDFRTKSALRLGGAPKLIKVPESGEVTHGNRAEARESYRLYSFARIFGITREALVNDDLGAFADFAQAYGVAAANLEAQELVDLLYGPAGFGPTMGDSVALFDSAHSNLNAAPAAISAATFSAGRLALRTARDLDGETVIECAPRYLIVPAALETTAETYLATIAAAEAANVNVFAGRFELIVDPRLDGKSATAWYLAADPAQAPVLEMAYLGDAQGPQVSSREGFEVLGLETRCVLDFGCGAVGHRGIWKGNN